MTVVAPGHAPEKYFGARDAFLRYAHESLDRDNLPVTVQPLTVDQPAELTYTDEDTLARARLLIESARALRPDATFLVAAEEGLGEVRADGETRHLVKTWAVVEILGLDPEARLQAWGCSGGLQIPSALLDPSAGSPPWTPTTRRGGGMMKSVTQSTETRRSSTALATFLALSSLLYGRVTG